MPTKNIVKEILPEQIKDVNPYEIIYLAMKDGSVIMIVDKEDAKFEPKNLNYNTEENTKKDVFINEKIPRSKNIINISDKKCTNKSFEKNSNDFNKKSDKIEDNNLNYTFNYSNQYQVTDSTFNNNSNRDHSQDINKSINMKNYKQFNNTKYSFDNNCYTENNRAISQKPKIGNNNNYIGDNKHYYQVRNDYYKKENQPISTIRYNNNRNNNIFSVSNSLFTDTNNNFNNNTFNASVERKLINVIQPMQKEEYLEISFEQKSVKTENLGGYYENNGRNFDKYGIYNYNNNARIRSQSFNQENIKKVGHRMNHICNCDNMGVHKILDPNCPKCREKAKEMNLDLINVGDGLFYDNHSYYQSYGFSGANKKYNHSPPNMKGEYYFP